MTPSGIEPATFRLVARCLNPSNAELNPICHLLEFLGSHHILHVSRIRVNQLCHRMHHYNVILINKKKTLFNQFVLFLFQLHTLIFSLVYIYNFSLHVSDRLVHHQENQTFNP